MQKHKNLLFFLLSLVLLAAALYYYRSADSVAFRGGGAFPLSADDKVSLLILSDNQNNVLRIKKQAAGVWLLNDSLEVDEQILREALFVLRRLEVKGPVAFDDRESANRFLHKEGIRLEVYRESHLLTLPGDRNLFRRHRKIRSLFLASGFPGEDDHLVMNQGDHVSYLADLPAGISNLYETFPVNAYKWRSRKLMHYLPHEILEIEIQHSDRPPESFSLHLDEKTVRINDHKGDSFDVTQVDMQRVGRFMNGFRHLFYEKALQVLMGAKPEDLLSDTPFLEITIKDIYDERRHLYFYRRRIPDDGTLTSEKKPYDPNRFYVREREDLYMLSLYHIFQPVMRPLSYFLIAPEND